MSRSGLMSALVILTVFATCARAQDDAPPAVGGVTSPQGAMIFYTAHGQNGACGPNCSDWIAAEGVVEWDTFKRLFAFMDRLGERKMPMVLHNWGAGDLKVASSLGKIIRDHRLDVRAGATIVADCAKVTETECVALKRSGKVIDARIDTTSVACDVNCVLVLAGGVHRTLPADATVVIGPTHIADRLAPNVSQERQVGLQTQFGNQFRLYLSQMGVSTEIADIIDRDAQTGRATQLSSKDWLRLGLVTTP
ncbi:MAG: hypothetical protein WA728_11970 [Xanthobacteraceae bacterium]